jgi:hypothetical protein
LKNFTVGCVTPRTPDSTPRATIRGPREQLWQIKLDPAENAPLLAPRLDIPLPRERAPTLAPDELRRRQLAAPTASVMASGRVQPGVLAIEDLHRADPTTLDVLRSIAGHGALAPLFIVSTTRPEFRPPWGIRSHHATSALAPLDHAQVRDGVGGAYRTNQRFTAQNSSRSYCSTEASPRSRSGVLPCPPLSLTHTNPPAARLSSPTSRATRPGHIRQDP